MSCTRKCFYLKLMAFLVICESVVATSRFTNVICKSLDKSFGVFQNCRLTVPKRGAIALSLYLKLLQTPISNATINLSLFKKVNGYRPFLSNITVDFCAFMANKKRVPFMKLYFDAFAKYSNFNHTCPYDHDIVFKNLVLRDDMFALFPIPGGEYMFKAVYAVHNEWKVELQLRLCKKPNGYRPFLSTLFADYCAIMSNRMRYPFLNIYLSFFIRALNLNYICPHDHDVIVKNLGLRDGQFQKSPVPAGNNLYRFVLGAFHFWRAEIQTYFTVRMN